MSGFYLTAQTSDDATAVASGLAFAPTTSAVSFREDAVAGVVTRVDALAHWGPAYDPASGVRVILGGRVALEAETWRAAADLPYEGGAAAKAVLAAWLERGERIALGLNGAFAVAVVDPRDRRLHLFTDRIGMFPVFVATTGPLRLCTHPDVLADALARAGQPPTLDRTTVAELLATARGVHPYTYYREIRQLDAGTHHTWRLDRPEATPDRREYWYPAYRDTPPPRRYQPELIEELADAYRAAVRRRTYDFLGRPAVLLSGGADSRGVLFGLEDPSRAACITFYGEENAELATARAIARAAGAEHHALQREPEHYGLGAPETVRISGAMFSANHGHQTRLLDRMRGLGIGVLLSGCYADCLFKGWAYNAQARRVFGHPIRHLKRLRPYSYEFNPNFKSYSLRPEWQAELQARFDQEMAGIDTDRYEETALLVEERRVRPVIRVPAVAFQLINWRSLPCDMVFADSGLLDLFGRMSPESKLSGLVFKQAVARICGAEAARIRDNNDGTRLDRGAVLKTVDFVASALGRRARRLVAGNGSRSPTGLSHGGSWINQDWYVAHSRVLLELWSSPRPAERELFADLLGEDPWSTDLPAWSRRPTLFFQILTARLWLNQRRLV